MTALVLIAKEPLPGRAKTRLHPPLSLEQAARLAAACIDDTVATMVATPVSRRVLFYDGGQVPDTARSFDRIGQPEGSLDERLATLFDALDEPVLLIGMDTPQVSPAHLAAAVDGLEGDDGPDAWFGPAHDGGFWALGMRSPRGDLVRGIPMSRTDTGELQHERLVAHGLRVGLLPALTDVDTIDDARVVADSAPDTAFARLLREFASPVFSA